MEYEKKMVYYEKGWKWGKMNKYESQILPLYILGFQTHALDRFATNAQEYSATHTFFTNRFILLERDPTESSFGCRLNGIAGEKSRGSREVWISNIEKVTMPTVVSHNKPPKPTIWESSYPLSLSLTHLLSLLFSPDIQESKSPNQYSIIHLYNRLFIMVYIFIWYRFKDWKKKGNVKFEIFLQNLKLPRPYVSKYFQSKLNPLSLFFSMLVKGVPNFCIEIVNLCAIATHEQLLNVYMHMWNIRI